MLSRFLSRKSGARMKNAHFPKAEPTLYTGAPPRAKHTAVRHIRLKRQGGSYPIDYGRVASSETELISDSSDCLAITSERTHHSGVESTPNTGFF